LRTRSRKGAPDRRRPRIGRIIGWSILGIVLIVVALGAVVGVAATEALSVRDDLSAAVPLASSAQKSIAVGDTDAAASTGRQSASAAAEALESADGFAWQVVELVPVLGQNFSAIRTAA